MYLLVFLYAQKMERAQKTHCKWPPRWRLAATNMLLVTRDIHWRGLGGGGCVYGGVLREGLPCRKGKGVVRKCGGVVGTCGWNMKPSRKNGHPRQTCRRVETWRPSCSAFSTP